MNSKLIVGLTGVFGSGKSTVAHLLEELGAARIDADQLAHEALWKGSEVYKKIAALFPGAEKPDAKELDRKVIAGIVFSDSSQRRELEKIIHPYVRVRIEEEVADASESIVVLEVPLLFEAGVDRFCDVTVTVSAPQEEIRKRLKEKGFSSADIQGRTEAQMPLKEKIERSDFVVTNTDTLEQTKQQVEKLWKELQKTKRS